MGAQEEKYPGFDVFISYSTRDKTVADAVVSAHEKAGIRCWYAPRDIPPGADWADAITRAVKHCSLMVLIFSKSSNRSQRVLDEVNLAINRGKPLLPFRVEDLEPTGAMELHLSSRHWLDAYHPGWEAHIDRLVKSVQANLDVEPVQQVEIKEPAEESNFETTGPKWPIKINHGFNLRWILGVTGLVILVGLSYLGWNAFGSQIFHLTATATNAIIPTQTPTQTPTPTSTPTMIPSPVPTSTVEVMEAPPSVKAVLDYIQTTDPTFEDDFSEPNHEVWDDFQNGYGIEDADRNTIQSISDMVWDGVLHVEGVPNDDGEIMTDFPHESDTLQAFNFVLQYEYEIENQPEGNASRESHGFVIRGGGGVYGIGVEINLEDDQASIYAGESSWHEDRNSAGVVGKTKGTLRVIAYGEDIALFLDDNLILFAKNQEITGTQNMIRVFGEEYRLLIDNVKFWTLDGVEIPQE